MYRIKVYCLRTSSQKPCSIESLWQPSHCWQRPLGGTALLIFLHEHPRISTAGLYVRSMNRSRPRLAPQGVGGHIRRTNPEYWSSHQASWELSTVETAGSVQRLP